MNEFNKDLGAFLKTARKKKNISTSQLASRLNISSSKLNNIENALNDCFQIQLLIDIGTVLEIDILNFIFTSFKEPEEKNIFQIQMVTDRLLKLKTCASEECFELILNKFLSDITLFENILKSRS